MQNARSHVRGSKVRSCLVALLAIGLLAWSMGCSQRDHRRRKGPSPSPVVDPDPVPVGRAQHSAVLLPEGTARLYRLDELGSLDDVLRLASERVTRELNPEERSVYLHE